MYGRSHTPAWLRGDQRRMLGPSYRSAREFGAEGWIGDHRAARIEARYNEARDRAFALWMTCGGRR